MIEQLQLFVVYYLLPYTNTCTKRIVYYIIFHTCTHVDDDCICIHVHIFITKLCTVLSNIFTGSQA